MNNLLNRTFKIWAYTVSHNFLILRSPLVPKDVDDFKDSYDYNLDIEFTYVQYMDIPATLIISSLTELIINIPEKFHFYNIVLKCKVFEVISNDNRYYIVAGSYRIGTNKWINEDRISNMSLAYDEILGESML
jgi:hypothetical protein